MTASGPAGTNYTDPLSAPLQSPPGMCTAAKSTPATVTLQANSSTVHWGYYYAGATPNLVINSGDTVNVEMCTQHGGDDYDKIVKGDPGIESIYNWTSSGPTVGWRGATGKGDGVHVLTGPIYVCGAEPGDVIQVDILDLEPRPNPGNDNRTYGSNAAASWGYHFRAGFLDGMKREIVTIYELIQAANGKSYVAVPDYQFKYGSFGLPQAPASYIGPVSNCTDFAGPLPELAQNLVYNFNNSGQTFRSMIQVPCMADNTQQWEGLYYPGVITQHPTGTEDYSIRGKFKVPINFHVGSMGLAQATNVTIDSVVPMMGGGNVDDRRMGIGATMYYPVAVEGGLISMGDAHTAQGDSEFDGTAIETNINGRFKITVHKKASLEPMLQNLDFPLLENANEYVVHGYTLKDYLTLPDPSQIYKMSSLDMAFTTAYNSTRDFAMRTFNLTEDQAITAVTTVMDFGVTQVVDGNWGVHVVIPKWAFTNLNDTTTPYAPVTISGTSTLLNATMPIIQTATAG
ncbi:hypothetical protein WJX82_006304 [Trebouxia sp. C0006]